MSAANCKWGGSTAELVNRSEFAKLIDTLYRKDWVVYAKKPFAGPAPLLKYLTRYTHRVALTNDRLVKATDDTVTLTYKDYADGCSRKEMTLAAVEFLRRFALHIVPGGFVRLRHYGLLTHRERGVRLAKCRELLAAAAPEQEKSAPPEPPRGTPWGLYLLLALLPLATLPGPLPSASVLASMLASGFDTASLRTLCPRCGSAEQETIWQAPRPNRRELEAHWCWDTS